ncbi:unnamed protein product [Amaranthus hypochondriacus]
MKLMKGIKKLKFWSKNKNKYQKLRLHHHHHYNFQTPSYHPPPPPPRPPPPPPSSQEEFHCHFYQPVEPSAPPLPPWLEMQLEPEPDTDPEPEPESEPKPEIEIEPDGEDCRNVSQEICVYSIKKDGVYSGSGKGAGVLGCVVEVGGFMFRCLFPCFHISHIHSKHTPPFHNLDFNHNKIL